VGRTPPKPRAAAVPRRLWPELALLFLILLVGGLGPRLVEARAAAAWAHHYALTTSGGARPAAATLEAARRAARAIERVAPLPPSGAAARDALSLARRLASSDRATSEQAVATLRDALRQAGARALLLRSLRRELDAAAAELAAPSAPAAPTASPTPATPTAATPTAEPPGPAGFREATPTATPTPGREP
jgi:hypothetical protein